MNVLCLQKNEAKFVLPGECVDYFDDLLMRIKFKRDQKPTDNIPFVKLATGDIVNLARDTWVNPVEAKVVIGKMEKA